MDIRANTNEHSKYYDLLNVYREVMPSYWVSGLWCMLWTPLFSDHARTSAIDRGPNRKVCKCFSTSGRASSSYRSKTKNPQHKLRAPRRSLAGVTIQFSNR